MNRLRACPTLVFAGVVVGGLLTGFGLFPGSCSRCAAGPGDDKSAAAKPLFQKRCQNCHSADGSGQAMRDTFPEIPDFRNAPWQKSRSDVQLSISIREGKGPHMPPFTGKLSKEEIDSLVPFIRAFGPKPANNEAEKPAADFELRFRQLQEEFDCLRAQFYELSARPKSAREANQELPRLHDAKPRPTQSAKREPG
jgi:mono/diheme cytochrome c family protein